MPSHDRYRFGDILLPEAESLARSLPALLRQQQVNDLDREKIALENKRIEAAKTQNDRLFEAQENARVQAAERYKEEFAFKKEQAKQAEMNRLVASVEEPYQKAMIYRKYGFNDLAENFTSIGDKQEAQKDVMRTFDSFTDPKDILENSSTALKGLDPTSSAATFVRNARTKAMEELDVKYSELLEKPGFRLVHEAYKNAQQDLTMSDEQKKLVNEQYIKALESYGVVEEADTGQGSVEDFDDDDVDRLVDDIVGGRGLNLSTGEITDTDKPIQEQAQESMQAAEMSLGQVNQALPKQRKKVQEARQQLNLAVSPEQKTEREKTLKFESAVLEELQSRMKEARTLGKQAEGVLKETRREQARFGFQPFR
jgi:hypothetical protein